MQEQLNLTFIRGEDAIPGLISCLKSAYGSKDNYVNPRAFEPDYLKSEIKQGKMEVFTGFTEDNIPVVTISAKKNPRFGRAFEICSLAVCKEYKGQNLGSRMVDYVMDFYKGKSNPLVYAHVVMFFSLICIACEDNNLKPTGFLFGVCDAKKHMAGLNITSTKHTWALYVRNNETKLTDTVYVPKRLNNITNHIYGTLGIEPQINNDETRPLKPSAIEYEQDEYHKTLYLYISASGLDLSDEINQLEENYTGSLQTYIVFLNINDETAIYGYETLFKSGYKFAGLKPLCGECEYILMTKTNNIIIDNAELEMTDSLKYLFERIGEVN